MHRPRVTLFALLTVLIVSSLAMTLRSGVNARSASPAPPVTAQSGFTLTSPAEGALVPCGQPITVTWTGGNPSDNVNLVLIDVQAFQVYQGFGIEPNTGSRVVTIGPGSCGRQSQFYVEDSPRTTWTYGPVFTVVYPPPQPTCATPPSNMVSWWPGDGNARDIQGGNNGAPAGGATFAPGKVGQAFSFDGIDDFVDVQPNANLDLTQALTIDAWVNPANLSGNKGIVEKTVGNGVNTQYSLFLSGGGVVFRLIKVPGVDHATIGSSSVIPINAWTHVAATWDGATMKLFINGTQQAQLAVAAPINGGIGPTLIGKQGSNINRFAGLIDEVEIFNRALTGQEILAIYLADSAGKCKPDGDGDGVSDATDNCINTFNSDQADADGNGVGDACQVPPTCVTPPSNMVSWWPGDGNADDIQDSNDGTLQNGATFASGKVGQAFSFDGVDDFVNVQDNANLNLTQAVTIDAWVNPSLVSQDRGIVEKTVGGGVNTQYLLYLQGGSVVFRLIKVPGVDHRTIGSDSVIPLNTWTHVAATWDGATMKLFVNGFQQAQTLAVAAPINGGAGPTLIGKQGSNINRFAGLIDEVEIFNRALSVQEILAIYQADSAGKCKPPTPDPCSGTVTLTIPSTAGPWNPSLNPAFDYGANARDNNSPIVIDATSGLAFTPGSTLTVTYLSGTVQAGGGYPFNDANGLPGYVRNYCENFGCFPAYFMNPRPDLLAMALVGAFTNNGVIVGYPFPIGNGPKTLTIPTGANQLSLGINDTRFSDNSGFFTVAVSGGSVEVAPVITNQPVSLSRCESQAATFSVTATGTGLTYQWRKNGTPINGATGNTFSIIAVNSGDAGSYDVVITGGCGSATSNAAVLTVNATTRIATQPVSQTSCLGTAASFSVTASGTGPFAYQWRKNGSNIAGATNNSFSIASVVAGDAGSYDVVVTGACGSVNSNSATLSVNLPPIANAGGPYTVNEGGSVSVTASGSDLEGGPLTFVWDLDNNGSFETPGQSVTFSAAGLDGPSGRIIKVQVTDNCNLPAIALGTVTVLNDAPAVGAIIAPIDPIPVNTTINTSASFTDAGLPDTHTALWHWDDPGNPTSAGAVTEANGSGTVSGSHSFTAAGVYEVKLTVTDDDGGAGLSIFQYIVVYDPNGGFVTGGGWIDSPAGAYGPDPTLSGRANFGFVSKYQPGANAPTGNTEFQFKAGNFNFQSTVYEWLVVAGAKAQYKGSGKVNGAGDYGFMLTATDGQINGGGGVDKFRIKIWDKASGVVVYDNKRGDSDDLDNANPQALGGGSIVIHKDT